MLLALTTTHRPATDLGYLLHKHPERVQSVPLKFGQAHVFYPEASEERCTACLLMEVDPVAIVRGKGRADGPLDQYVNDRPYAASSFLSVALVKVFGTALNGHCKERPGLAQTAIPLRAQLPVLPARGGEGLLRGLFEPLGYTVSVESHVLDENFPAWGRSPYFSVVLERCCTLSELLKHLYVLVPVLDDSKHYFVADDEIDKLLRQGEGWLSEHPLCAQITERYLVHLRRLTRLALSRLVEDDPDAAQAGHDAEEEAVEKPLRLNDQRLASVLAALKSSGATRVLDLGCGSGKLLARLLRDHTFAEIVGVDVSLASLHIAEQRLRLAELPEKQRQRIRLLHGSLCYRDARLAGYDAAAVVEVIEHLDPHRLESFTRALFGEARPRVVVLTTPNREYNSLFAGLAAGRLRHKDHRFEFTRQQFQAWAAAVASDYGYQARYETVGPVDAERGSPTQMVVFSVQSPKEAES